MAHTHDGTAGNGPKIAASNITVADAGNNYAATDVEGALTELFTNVSNGKTAVASAITGKGVAASGSDTFAQLSTKINAISTGTGNAVAADVLASKTFTNGSSAGLTGTMPNNGAVTITPSASSQAIPAGYHNGSGSVPAVTVPAANVLTGTTIAGTAGTMPNRGAVSITPGTSAQTIQAGYHNGSGTVAGDANLVAANILSGVSIFGVAGTAYKLVNLTSATQKGHLGTSDVVERQITMSVASQISLSVDLFNSNVNGYCYGRWFKNGSLIGGSAQSNSQTRARLTVVTTCMPGDVFEMRQYGEFSGVWCGNENMVIVSYVSPQTGGTINIS